MRLTIFRRINSRGQDTGIYGTLDYGFKNSFWYSGVFQAFEHIKSV